MTQSTITIDITLDKDKLPEGIHWQASGSTADTKQRAKAMLLGLWDGADKSALRIDLWTKDMMVDEMGDFFYQTIVGMADTYQRATGHKELVDNMKRFAKEFYTAFREHQLKEHKA
ncbi:MAG: gliding motility protein GldC [Williamsia sp.]|nr:gliding motility protein GldC [Williamsia sp.]